MSSRTRFNHRCCHSCDSSGNLHLCHGCGNMFHADQSCSGRRETRTSLSENGPIVCGDCFAKRCLKCAKSFQTTEVIGCYEISGGCGDIFHCDCLGYNENEYLTFDDRKLWKCEQCCEMQNLSDTQEEIREKEEQQIGVDKQSHNNEDAFDEFPGLHSDESDDWNEICSSCGQDGNLLCCDGCPAAYHVACVGLSRMPPSSVDWFCPNCSQIREYKKKQQSTTSSQLQPSLEQNHGDDVQDEMNNINNNGEREVKDQEVDYWDELCGVCERGGDLLCCDGCPNSFHLGCLQIPPSLDDEIWLCKQCESHVCAACGSSSPALTINNHIICGPDGVLNNSEDDEGDEDGWGQTNEYSSKKNSKKGRRRSGSKKKASNTKRIKLGCRKIFHLQCVGLSSVPQGDWFCRECQLYQPDIYDISTAQKEKTETKLKLLQMMKYGQTSGSSIRYNDNVTNIHKLMKTNDFIHLEKEEEENNQQYDKIFHSIRRNNKKYRELGWMGLDLEDDGSSLWSQVDIIDSPKEFLNADTVSVLYRGGELDGRFAILPNPQNNENDQRYLCHSSDLRWKWHKVKPRGCGLWQREPSLEWRVKRSKINTPMVATATASSSGPIRPITAMNNDARNIERRKTDQRQLFAERKAKNAERIQREAVKHLSALDKWRLFHRQFHPHHLLKHVQQEHQPEQQLQQQGLFQQDEDYATNFKQYLPKIHCLHLISYSARARQGSGAVPEAHLSFDVRHLNHPCLSIPSPLPPSIDIEEKNVNADFNVCDIENGETVDDEDVCEDGYSGEKGNDLMDPTFEEKNDSSIQPIEDSLKNNNKIDEVIGDEAGGEDIEDDDDDENIKNNNEEENVQKSIGNETAFQEKSDSFTKPWWWSLTGHDPRVLKEVMNDDKFIDLIRIIDAALFRLAFHFHHPNVEQKLKENFPLNKEPMMYHSYDDNGVSGDCSTNFKHNLNKTQEKGNVLLHRPRRSSSLLMHAGSYNEGLMEKKQYQEQQSTAQDSKNQNNVIDNDDDEHNDSVRGGQSNILHNPPIGDMGSKDIDNPRCEISIAFHCYEGRIRSVACAELIKKLFEIRYNKIIVQEDKITHEYNENDVLLKKKQTIKKTTNQKKKYSMNKTLKSFEINEPSQGKTKQINTKSPETKDIEIISNDKNDKNLEERLLSGVGIGLTHVLNVNTSHLEIFDTLNCNSSSLNNQNDGFAASSGHELESSPNKRSIMENDDTQVKKKKKENGELDKTNQGEEVCDSYLWMSWNDAWFTLRKEGWSRYHGQGIDTNTYYVAPDIPKSKGIPVGVRGRDYFTKTEAVITHAQRLSQQRSFS